MLPPTLKEAIDAGRLDEAEAICRQVIAQQPASAEAHDVLGVLLRNRGQTAAAVVSHRLAISYQCDVSQFHNNLGVALTDLGQFDEAIHAIRRAIEIAPRDPELYGNLALLLMKFGQLDEARATLSTAISLGPDSFQLKYNLGVVLYAIGRTVEAIAAYTNAIRLKPDCGEAWCNLGVALRTNGQLPHAVAAYTRAIELMPRSADAHANRGVAFAVMDRLDDAIVDYRLAIQFEPYHANAHFNLGNAFRDQARLEEAIGVFQKAIQIKPGFLAAQVNLANALGRVGQHHAAMVAYDTAIEIEPRSADVHWNRSLALLLRGDFERGWEEYEWRNRLHPPSSQLFPQPQWHGEPLAGRTILLHAEHGLGDTVQFVRYVPLVAERGGQVILRCQPELYELLKQIPGVHKLVVEGDPLPAFDLHCPLMSLPRAFGTRLDSIPANIPYLLPDSVRLETWRTILGSSPRRRRVGLVWAGRPQHQYDLHRSIPLPALAPLFAVEGVEFLSLQKGDAARQIVSFQTAMPLTDQTALLHDYADTAALIAHLDLVIAVDTSVAHVAAAMGKPVWLLVAFAPDWRWQLGRSDSPWYPTMRLFRQTSRGDWPGVIAEVAECLVRWISRQMVCDPAASATTPTPFHRTWSPGGR